MLLLAVLLTQVAYSYWANGFEIRANGSNTLNVQIGQAPGGKLTLDYNYSKSTNRVSLVPTSQLSNSTLGTDKGADAVNAQSKFVGDKIYVLFKITSTLEENPNASLLADFDFTLSSKVGEMDVSSLFSLRHAIVTNELVPEFNEANSTNKPQHVDGINRLKTVIDQGKSQAIINNKATNHFVLLEITMVKTPDTQEEYQKIANQVVKFYVEAAVEKVQ